MEKNYQKEYIDISTELRKSNSSKESLYKLFDLLYEIKKVNRTKSENLTLSNIYTLLGFHQSAFELYKSNIDYKDRKVTKKLYTLEQKAKSHGNNFIIKDIRKLRKKNEQIKLLREDFKVDENGENKFLLKNKDIVIFNKPVKHDKFEIYMYGDYKFEDYITKIIKYISWLGNCRNVLIKFYNSELNEQTEETANEDWFDTLEIFSVRIIIGQNGKLFSEISAGDEFMSDHILDIETEEQKITQMNYDG